VDILVIIFSAASALAAGLFTPLLPDFWVPHLRSEILARESRHRAARIIVSAVGQAFTTSLVSLIVTIVLFSVLTIAGDGMSLWAGILVCGMAVAHYVRHRNSGEDAAKLESLCQANAARWGSDPYGDYDRSPWETAQNAVFAPAFLLTPFFFAAAGSGLPSVDNGFPTAVTYLVGSLIGSLVVVRGLAQKTRIESKSGSPPIDAPQSGALRLIPAYIAAAMFVAGVLTAFSGATQ
jgi:hypothetical protein